MSLLTPSHHSHNPAVQVRNPRVEAPSSPSYDTDEFLVWDSHVHATIYGRVASPTANGQDGLVQQMSCSKPGGRQLALQSVAVPDDTYKIRLILRSFS